MANFGGERVGIAIQSIRFARCCLEASISTFFSSLHLERPLIYLRQQSTPISGRRSASVSLIIPLFGRKCVPLLPILPILACSQH